MTTAGFNIKTTYFVRYNRLFFILGDNVFKRKPIFILACGRVFFDQSRLFRRECDPARWTYFLNMEETQDRRDIGFINIRIRLHICVFENITVWFKNPRLPVTWCKDVAIPEILYAIHHRRILEHEKDELVILPPVKPV